MSNTNEIVKWAQEPSYGPFPWAMATVESAVEAWETVVARLEHGLLDFKSLSTPGWKEFESLSALWMELDEVSQVIQALGMLNVDTFGSVKRDVEKAMADWTEAMSCDRKLALQLKKVQDGASFAWQKNAIDGCFWGGTAWERKTQRAKRLSLEKRQAQASEKFEKNITDSIALNPVWCMSKAETAGLPDWLVERARARAQARGLKGFLFLADTREYTTFMSYCENRELRRQMYQARAKAASEQARGSHDNAALAKDLLRMRKQEASWNGHESYADYAMSNHMLDTPEQVEAVLKDMANAAMVPAMAERAQIDSFLKERGDIKRLEPWDYRFGRAEVIKDLYGEALLESQSFFSPIKTIEAAVILSAESLGVKAKRERDREVGDLMVFKIQDAHGAAHWITIATKERKGHEELVAFEWDLKQPIFTLGRQGEALIFLQMETQKNGRLVNLTHGDVVVLFHELGHAFHTVLARARAMNETARMVETDALEMHSQWMEQLAWDPEVLSRLGRKKGRALSRKMIDKLLELKNFHSGAWAISQLTDALCDLRLHKDFKPSGRLEAWEIGQAARREVALDRPKSYARQANQMSELTSSYACAGYAYLWGEALVAGINQAFQEQQKLHGKREAKRALREQIFETGAKRSMNAIIRKFTGKKAKSEWFVSGRGWA